MTVAKDVLEYIARNLVDELDAVEVTEVEGEGKVHLQLRVAPDDMGKIIGKGGRTARAIRTVVQMAGTLHGFGTSVEIRE